MAESNEEPWEVPSLAVMPSAAPLPASPPLPPTAVVPPPLTLGYAPAGLVPYLPPGRWAKVIVRWQWLIVCGHVITLWPTVVTLLGRVAAARRVGQSDSLNDEYFLYEGPVPVDLIVQLMGLASMVVLVYWLLWVHRTYRNLPALGAEGLRSTPTWAVLYYFIPVVHLFRPFQVMHETWRASDPAHAGGTSWKATPKSRLVNWWWGTRVAPSPACSRTAAASSTRP